MSKLILANWKLNPITKSDAIALSEKITKLSAHTVVLCPPAPYLAVIDYPYKGAQDVFWKAKGPFTGQVSPAQLADLGVNYCIVGHSERRALGESDQEIHNKLEALLAHRITPVLCVGFNTTVNEDDLEVTEVLKGQLEAVLPGLDASKIVVAYEPVWAISSGNPYATKKMATPEHAEKICIYIKTKFGVRQAIYGGSVTSVNAQGFLEQPNVGGLLVGGASLLADDFNKIIDT